MEKNNLDALLAGASAEETNRIHRMLHQWGVGPEDSYPVQLALLTKAQWRMAASIPRSMEDCRKLIEANLAEYRQQTAAWLKGFNDSSDTRITAFEKTAENYVEGMKLVAAQTHGHMTETERAARQARLLLENTTAESSRELRQIREDIQKERDLMEKARQDMNQRSGWQDWLKVLLIFLAIFTIGTGFGWFLHPWK